MDEAQPLLQPVLQPVLHHIHHDPQSLIDFDPNGDPENPLQWSEAYKRVVVFILGIMAFIVTFTVCGIVPVAERIVLDLEGSESKSTGILLVSVWELGEAAGPLIIGPLSEIYGRYPAFNVANVIFIFGALLGALSQSARVLIFSRFLTGFAVASNVLNPAVIGDIYPPEKRGSGISLVMLAPLLGGAIGPAIGGTIAETIGWRYILWLSALLAFICEVLFFALFRETYKVPILQRRAARLREERKDKSLKCAWETECKGSAWLAIRVSVGRPFTVLLRSLVLQIMSLYGGLMFAFYYILATTLPALLREYYGFSPSLIGLSFLSFSFGASGGIILCNLFLDSIYVKLGASHGGIALPEYRLPFMVGGAFFIPFVVMLYGWAPYAHWPVFLLLLAVSLLGLVMMFIFVPLASYIVDAFGLYSASAMTMVLVARCLSGTLLPLTIPPLTDALGLGPGFLLLGVISLLLAPLPAIIMRYGSHLRQSSVYTKI